LQIIYLLIVVNCYIVEDENENKGDH